MMMMMLTQFGQLTRDGEVYHEYCLNYSKAMTYLEQLRKTDEFVEFEKVRRATCHSRHSSAQGIKCPQEQGVPVTGVGPFLNLFGLRVFHAFESNACHGVHMHEF